MVGRTLQYPLRTPQQVPMSQRSLNNILGTKLTRTFTSRILPRIPLPHGGQPQTISKRVTALHKETSVFPRSNLIYQPWKHQHIQASTQQSSLSRSRVCQQARRHTLPGSSHHQGIRLIVYLARAQSSAESVLYKVHSLNEPHSPLKLASHLPTLSNHTQNTPKDLLTTNLLSRHIGRISAMPRM